MNAVVYCRVSSQAQVDNGHGAESQEFACIQYAKAKGWNVIKVFSDKAYSGALEDRPEANKMLLFLLDNPDTIVLMDDISRQARDREIYYNLKKKIQKLDCTVKFVNLDIPENEDGEFFELVSVGMAQWQRKKNRTQVLNRMKARLSSGYWCFSGTPRGYKYDSDKNLVLDEPEASIVKQALEGYATNSLKSQKDVLDFCLANNFKTSKSQVQIILSNPIYTGKIINENWNIVVEQGRHEPLISKETHETILAKLGGKFVFVRKSENDNLFLLRGVVKCFECKKLLKSYVTTKINAKTKLKKLFPKYDCRNRHCGNKYHSITRDNLESQIEEAINNFKPSPAIFKLIEITITNILKDMQAYNLSSKLSIENELNAKKEQIQKILNRIKKAQRDSVAEALEEELDELITAKSNLEMKLESTKADFASGNGRTLIFEITKFLKNLDSEWKNGNIEKRKSIINLLFDDQIYYDVKQGGRTVYNSPFIQLFSTLETNKNTLVEVAGFAPASN